MLALPALLLAATETIANPLRSRFTTVELSTCQIIKRHPDGNTYRCAGLKDYPVSYSEGDLRAFVSFGAKPESRQAMQQTLRPFNSIFEGSGKRATIEWRFRRVDGSDRPYATIMRLFTRTEGARGEVLVVTKVSSTEACHMAYVDAKANADAMALARSAADELAAAWSCKADARIIGAPGQLSK